MIAIVSYNTKEEMMETLQKKGEQIIFNRWVVPYNVDLLLHCGAHIDIEKVAQTKVYSYLWKYVNKGNDWATGVIKENSEPQQCNQIKQYLDFWCISSIEECWRIKIICHGCHGWIFAMVVYVDPHYVRKRF